MEIVHLKAARWETFGEGVAIGFLIGSFLILAWVLWKTRQR